MNFPKKIKNKGECKLDMSHLHSPFDSIKASDFSTLSHCIIPFYNLIRLLIFIKFANITDERSLNLR